VGVRATRASTLGFLGRLDLSSFGAALADRLLLKSLGSLANRFVAHDPSSSTLSFWTEQKFRMGNLERGSLLPAQTPCNVAQMAARVVVCFDSQDQVQEAFLAPELGFLEGVRTLEGQRTLIVDCTTWSPRDIGPFAAASKELKVDYVNAVHLSSECGLCVVILLTGLSGTACS
jgi:hypothetical protein